MIPDIVKDFLLAQKSGQGCFCLAINSKLNIIQYFGKAKQIGILPPKYEIPISEYLPILLTETFDSNFEIPFYNIDDKHVCNIYFLKSKKISYLILLDRSEIYQVTQKYQQFAHDDNISKNKFKRLAQELDKAKERINKSDKEKATLIAMLSHEIGTPLTSIIGYSELLLNKTNNSQKELKVIYRNATYLKHMIENTLLFGRSEAGGLQIQIEEISIQNLFNVLKATLLPAAQNKNLILNMFYKGNETINIDITRTKQILINLLNNAVKYTEKGSVELKISFMDNKYIFSIIDTGLGVPEDQQNAIFDQWKRIEENAEQGSGIGLFISQKLAHAIGGELKLKYTSREFGSIFQLLIPIQEVTDSTNNAKIEESTKCHDKSLLVIDDDQDILDLIEAFLQSSGLNIYTSTNMTDAELTLKNNNIDIVLTDYNLGIIKANHYIKNIRQHNKNAPIILMTAMPSNKLKQSYKQEGFDVVISKPLDSKKLLSTILENIK